jgi:hypothetical protein
MTHLGRKLGFVVAAILVKTFTMVLVGNAVDKSDDRYLLVRRAGPPEKNYYDLSRTAQFLEPQLFNDTFFSRYQPSPKGIGIDVITETSVRYGTYQIWKVRVLAGYDTDNAASSAKDSVYLLDYPRQPDWKFCARKYTLTALGGGARSLTYTDFQDGKEYVMNLTPSWPRSWRVFELEILNDNAFPEIWQASKRTLEKVQ